MPSILSKDLKAKLLGGEWSFGYNCYEVGHSWTPSCTDAALEISLSAASSVMPLYFLLYSFTQVGVQRKFDLEATWDTIKSTLRSSFFIFFHAYNGAAIGCGMRNGLGRFYYRVLVCIPALLSSYLALLIEKPARRQALAFYMLNLASEIVYRMAVTKGYFKPMKYGETLLFAMSLSAWYHFIKVHGFGHDPVSAAVKVLIGREEAKSRIKRSASDTVQLEQAPVTNNPSDTVKNWYQQCYKYLFAYRHACCPHSSSSCLYYVLEPVPTRFLLGYTIQAVLGLTRNPYKLLQDPISTIRDSFTSRSTFRFGLFIMTLVSGGRLTNCILRHISGSDQVWHGSVSGFVAGLSMFWAPRSSLSMYIMWKAVEQYYLQLARQGKVKYKDFTILTIYAASASTILYTFALEPKFVRPSYMKFLDNLSNHRLHQLNRMVLDVFGTGSSVGYENFFPDLDPKYMSNQFKELIFNWMIQPYE